MQRTVPSPDSKQAVHFEFEGEIPFGPAYFTMLLNAQSLAHRSFGDVAIWSNDSRYVAVQEWLSTSKGAGPQTALLCIDTANCSQCVVSTAKQGFIYPVQFEGESLIYKKQYFDAQGEKTIEYEIKFTDLPRWEQVLVQA
jgi:hypothetical protein